MTAAPDVDDERWAGVETVDERPAVVHKGSNGNGQGDPTIADVPRPDLSAEKAVLGATLLRPDLIPELAGIVGDDDWAHPAHGAVWNAVTDLHATGSPVDTLTVAQAVGTHRALSGLGGPLYVNELANDPAVLPDQATWHARIVATKAQERRTSALGVKLHQAGLNGTDPETIREWLEEHLAGQQAPGTGSARYQQLKDALLDADGLKNIPPPLPLINGYIMSDSLTWLQGKPGHGKSFVAIDFACSVSTGLPWRGAAVHQGPVVYVIAEGASGISLRVDAWRDSHGVHDLPGLHFLPVPVQFLDDTDVAALGRLVAEIKPVMVVIDTQARVTVGAEENSSRDMGMFVAAADAIRAASNTCVLIVHHEGRSGEHLRGSTAMEGAATTILRAVKDGPLVYLECKKQKDDDEFQEISMRLVKLGESAVLSHEMVGMASVTTETEHQLIATLRESFGPEGVASTNLREAAGLPKTTYFRALRTLEGRGVVTNVGTSRRPLYVLASEAATTPEQTPLDTQDEEPPW